jgi:hypothetical protein
MRPTAAEILATPPKRHRRVSGYLALATVLLAVLGIAVTGIGRYGNGANVSRATAAGTSISILPAAPAGAPSSPASSLPPASTARDLRPVPSSHDANRDQERERAERDH